MKASIADTILALVGKSVVSSLKERLTALVERMKLKKILSLRALIVLGFLVAVIPLFLAVMYAAFGMRETSALGRIINSQVFEQTKAVRLVMQKTADIERKARLFVLLSDPAVRQPYEQQSYESTRESFKQALQTLLKLHVDNKIALAVNELAEKENLIYQQIIGSAKENELKLPVNEAFQGLRETSYDLSQLFESHVDQQFSELRQQSESLEQGLLVKGAVLLIISISFIIGLLAVISRSMQQLDGGIRRLGSGELEAPVEVTGPSDMRYLGNRLEWLRTHLLEIEASKHQFVQNVAREIDLPLENIRESVEQLMTMADESTTGNRQLITEQLRDNADKLKAIANELVRYSQLNAKPDLKRKDTVDIKLLLESVIEDFQPDLNVKSISLKKLVKPVEISGSNAQLRSIIEQLLSNAVKYSPMGGEIRIMLRNSGDRMELEIEDEGPGIDPVDRLHVFEPFFRGNSTSEEAAQGSGLGLAIVREYVANHQGKVEIIDSRQDQQGARLRVQIPLPETF